jgi:hypothetical protein
MRAIASFILAVMAVCCASPAAADELALAPEEYAVLSVLIDSLYAGDYALVVIGPRTERWSINAPLHVLQEQWPDLKQETIDSLIVRNSMTADVADEFAIHGDYRIVPEAEYREVLGGGDSPDWDRFDSMFVDAQGYLVVSRVGFDAERTQALVYFSNAYRCSGSRIRPATRNIAYLRKTEGSWELIGVERGLQALY